MRYALLLAIFVAALVAAAPPALQAQGDERVARLVSEPGVRLTLRTARRTAQTILFPDGEQIIDVLNSAPAAYQTGISAGGDSLVLVSRSEIGQAQLTVETQAARYEFDLVPVDAAEAPLVIHVGPVSGGAYGMGAQDVPPDTGQYRLSGDRVVRPAAISDDGSKTFIRWRDNQAMPAVFGVGPSGDEEMVEGHMRAGYYTIDRVYAELVFRIDKEKAKAQRRRERKRR